MNGLNIDYIHYANTGEIKTNQITNTMDNQPKTLAQLIQEEPELTKEIFLQGIRSYHLIPNDASELYFEKLKKQSLIRKPLFKDEKDYDVFEGEEYWFVHGDFSIGKGIGATSLNPQIFNNCFRCKADAEEYVLYNKPCISYNDLLDLSRKYKNETCIHHLETFLFSIDSLLTLIKEKQGK